MVAKNLLNGASWDTIDLKLDNWDKKYTKKKDEKDVEKAKTENENLGKEGEASAKPSLENKSGEFSEEDLISDSSAEKYKKNKQLMSKDKHPRLTKIKNWFKKILKKEEKMLPEPEEKGKSEKIKAASALNKTEEPKEKDEDKSFREYIKAVAEKGMDGVSMEEKVAKQEKAERKLAEMREANRAAEAEKFGQDYAKKSDYRNKGEER